MVFTLDCNTLQLYSGTTSHEYYQVGGEVGGEDIPFGTIPCRENSHALCSCTNRNCGGIVHHYRASGNKVFVFRAKMFPFAKTFLS